MTDSLHGKTAIVTGGASGIGRASVLRFLDAGARVVIGDLNATAGETLIAELGDRAADCRFVAADVSDEDAVAGLVATAVQAFGGLDVMFNNAGIGGALGPITHIDYADWKRSFDILVGSVFLGTKHAARQMIGQGRGGAVINTASIAGLGGGAGPQAYSAAKAAVINFTRTAAVELARHRIRVNAICPGPIFTPLMLLGADEQDTARTIAETVPWPDRGEPDHIAASALWLASADSAYVSGQAIAVDGALTAAGPRLWQQMAGAQPLDKAAGFSHGTTGQPHTIKRIDPTTLR